VLVADGQGSVAETKRMVDEIAKITPRPITHVVIASDHGDHTAGNAAFPPGVTYFIHPTSKAVMDTGAWKDAPPTHLLVNTRTILKVGGREIHVAFLGRAHTGGDLSVYLPAERILFMSEAYLNRIFPAMRSAFPSEWVKTIEKAQGMNVDRYVPGHGFVETPAILKEELETFKQAIVKVIAEGRRLHAAGVPVETAVTQARFGDLDGWTIRKGQGPIAIRRVYLEIEGKLPK
jgi:glyoxylase-like metal-dependent hydrolase (beta-lactamase superfamily II)